MEFLNQMMREGFSLLSASFAALLLRIYMVAGDEDNRTPGQKASPGPKPSRSIASIALPIGHECGSTVSCPCRKHQDGSNAGWVLYVCSNIGLAIS